MNMDFTKITRANFAFFQTAEVRVQKRCSSATCRLCPSSHVRHLSYQDGSGYIYGTASWADPIALFGPYDWMSDPGTAPEYCSWDAPDEPPACAGQPATWIAPSVAPWALSAKCWQGRLFSQDARQSGRDDREMVYVPAPIGR